MSEIESSRERERGKERKSVCVCYQSMRMEWRGGKNGGRGFREGGSERRSLRVESWIERKLGS